MVKREEEKTALIILSISPFFLKRTYPFGM